MNAASPNVADAETYLEILDGHLQYGFDLQILRRALLFDMDILTLLWTLTWLQTHCELLWLTRRIEPISNK